MKTLFHTSVLSLGIAASPFALAQPFDIMTFDGTAAGPWSNLAATTQVVPKVANGSITLDGVPNAAEYGGFTGVTVTPGENAWILDFPADRAWDGPDDSSFTFWLAHDDDNFYVGVQVKDDVVTSDDPNGSFWKDDAIEIVVDALSDRIDNNTDSSKDLVGGHSYVNFEGRFSAWDDATATVTGTSWATGVDWTYGPTNDVYGVGKPAAGGWGLEVRLKKRLFEDATAGNKLRNGYRMGFNIGLDDDDKHGTGVNGDKSRTEDLEIQYFWANRQRRVGLTADYLAALTPEERASKVWTLDPAADARGLPLAIDNNGRLSHAGTGEIFFAADKDPVAASKNILFITSDATALLNADAALVAFLRAKGYTVTPLTPPATADELRAAAVGKQLVLISETIGSGTVLDPVNDVVGKFSLQDTDVPIISFEAYMYDNADWVKRTEDGSNDWINWGNTARSEVPAEVQDARDSLYIVKPTHPIAGGLTGKVKVYNVLYSFHWGVPSADADVIASVQPDGTYPTLFVYDKGDKLADGSIAPNKRIGFFLGQVAVPNANWPTDFGDLTEDGKTLLLNTIAYALGTGGTQPGTLTLTATRAANKINITWTDAAAKLESASAVNGPFTAVPNATSPYQQDLSASQQQFFRLKK